MGAAVAAVIARRERDLVETFRAAGATAPERARSLESFGLDDSLIVGRLRKRAVLREAAPGQLYLDEPSWEALRGMRRRAVLVVLILAAAIALSLALGARAGRRADQHPPDAGQQQPR